MKYIDIHTHSNFSTNESIVVRNLSLSEGENFTALDEEGFVSVGIHPWDIEKLDEDWFVRLQKVVEDKRIAMIGECGLDKNIETELELQKDIFTKQIQLSESIKKPLIIHCVGRFNELIELKKIHNPFQKWIIHGFRGKPQLAEQLLRAGFDLSFGEKFNPESVEITPVERIFVETDESTVPVGQIYEQIAEIKGCKVEELNSGRKILKFE